MSADRFPEVSDNQDDHQQLAQPSADPGNKDMVFLARHTLQSGFIEVCTASWEEFKGYFVWAGEDGSGFETPAAAMTAAAAAGILSERFPPPVRLRDFFRKDRAEEYDAVPVRLDIEAEITAAIADALADGQAVLDQTQGKVPPPSVGSAWRSAVDTTKPGPWGVASRRQFLRACDLRTDPRGGRTVKPEQAAVKAHPVAISTPKPQTRVLATHLHDFGSEETLPSGHVARRCSICGTLDR